MHLFCYNEFASARVAFSIHVLWVWAGAKTVDLENVKTQSFFLFISAFSSAKLQFPQTLNKSNLKTFKLLIHIKDKT